MLEIRHVTKTYTPKKGIPVKALDDVSLKFEDKGMVFILGKSGSGKSTLLNVLGGLDRADSGEFIIKGKSSNNFTQSDFDSYRNTFIGFIFQEYNILPEFTVGANIALAMQLQGKKATNEALNEILDEVDLTGYGNRKPNELSGGQNQRVAIARALVKNPEMIMADEPTGALDSKTGKQVFDTLKKLSKEKLVLIVSHDRDFAELYADRIIELKDGKVISDVTKSSVKPHEVSEGVSAVDEHVLRIKQGYRLTARDLELIQRYISNADGDTLISTGGKENVEVKKVLKINDDGGKDEFLDTKPEDVKLKDYSAEDNKLVRSHLPFRNSLRIGASSLKVKPFRLVLTILLCVVAFAMFGLADTVAAYDKYTTYERSIMDSKIAGAAFTKTRFRSYDDDYDAVVDDDAPIKDEKRGYFNETLMGKADVAKIEETVGIPMLAVYSGSLWGGDISFSNSIANSSKLSSDNGTLYNMRLSGFSEVTQASLDKTGLKLSAGRVPATPGEILITNFVYDQFAIAGMRGGDGTNAKFTPASPQEILNKTISVNWRGNDLQFTVVGVVETDFDTSKYSKYLPSAEKVETGIADMITASELDAVLTYSFHTIGFVAPGSIDMMESAKNGTENVPSNSKSLNAFEYNMNLSSSGDKSMGFRYIASLASLTDGDALVWTNGAKTKLDDGEVILPFRLSDNDYNMLCSAALVDKLIENGYYEETDRDYLENSNLSDVVNNISDRAIAKGVKTDYSEKGYPETFRTAALAWNVISADSDDSYVSEAYRQYLRISSGTGYYGHSGGYLVNEFGSTPGYLYERAALKLIVATENIGCNSMSETGSLDIYGPKYKRGQYKIVGYYLPTPNFAITQEWSGDTTIGSISNFGSDVPAIVDDDTYNMIGKNEDIYRFCIGKMPYTNASEIRQIVKFNYETFGRIRYQLNNEVSSTLNMMDSMVETLSQVFLYVGIGFAVFAALMLFNFISVSISYKKREIGILRAVGARGADVFGIFFNESMIITLINWLFASIATVVGAWLINNSLRESGGFSLTLLNVGIRQFALILGVGILVAFISTFLPVLKISRKRPIDAIRNR